MEICDAIVDFSRALASVDTLKYSCTALEIVLL